MHNEKLSKNFYLNEFKCQCLNYCGGSSPIPSARLIELCETIRRKVNERVEFEFIMKITSAFRCLNHNRTKALGSNDYSEHPKNNAIDFRDLFHRVSVSLLYRCTEEALKEMRIKGGVGKYNTFVHADIREKKARW